MLAHSIKLKGWAIKLVMSVSKTSFCTAKENGLLFIVIRCALLQDTVKPGYKRTGYRRNLVIRDENAATKFFYIIKPGYRRNWL